MKPIVLVGQPLPADVVRTLTGPFTLVPYERGAIPPEAAEAVAALGFAPPADLLDRAPRLRTVVTISAGYDAFDVPDLTRRGILLMNAPDALTETTADLAFALILAAARRVVELAEWIKAGQWTPGLTEDRFGLDVYGKTLGVVGLGRIGTAVARRGALGFGMRVLYAGPSRKPDAERDLAAVRCALPELLAQSDFVCLATPLRPETERLIGSGELATMKRSAILVNIGRGRLVDEAALVDALGNGTIRAAGLDVFEREPLPLNSPLLALPNLVALPHIGSATQETRDAMAAEAAHVLIGYLVDGVAKNAVNPEILAANAP
jgi:gluconate 2-dehydrogenase